MVSNHGAKPSSFEAELKELLKSGFDGESRCKSNKQITLSILASLLLILAILFCYEFFNSLRYIAINQDYIIFINAITNREVKYLFNDIASVEITGSRISDMLKLTLKSGRSKYISVNMVTSEELKTVYKITNERISTT